MNTSLSFGGGLTAPSRQLAESVPRCNHREGTSSVLAPTRCWPSRPDESARAVVPGSGSVSRQLAPSWTRSAAMLRILFRTSTSTSRPGSGSY